MLFKKKKSCIDLEKGKNLYYNYYGSKFQMYRDSGDEYENCNVPEETEIEWSTDILRALENEIADSSGWDLQVAVDRYMNLFHAGPEWLMLFLQTRKMDTFTAIIFCEQLKDEIRLLKDKVKSAYIRHFLDETKDRLLREPITIHETYRPSKYMSDYDFSDENIKMRIADI